jgi:polyphosphate:AMP phosphotransferase
MLNELALDKKVDAKTYKTEIKDLEEKLALLQRKAKEQKMPTLIVFEGWEAAGKGTMINELLMPLDPRGYNAYFIKEPTEEEYYRPFLWRFWTKTPEKGRIALFDQSWYRHVSIEKMDGRYQKGEDRAAFEDINSFEKQLADDGVLIIKFFLHISRGEQKKRLEELAADPATAWKVEKKDWKMNKQYEKYVTVYEKMIQETDTEYAPWTIVEAQSKKFAKLKIFTKVADAMQAGLDALEKKEAEEAAADACLPDGDLASSVLDKIDLAKVIKEEDYKNELKRCQKRIREVEHEIYMRRIPIIIAYEGWDAAGKGGNIKRMVENLDPRGYEVVPICAPNDIEKSHHYLWRFWNRIPKAGHIAIFDRTWYGRVLVERIEGLCSCAEWRRAYREINDMEKQLTNFGTILIKFWLQIDKGEQLRRFEEREHTPAKNYKITEEDWRNRDKWDAYETAVNEMLFRTNTTYAPWVVVESEDKHYARIKALKTVIEQAEKRL